MSYLWTSEAVSSGHPDKVADQISDAVVDAYLAVDPMARVACECAVSPGLVLLQGEIGSVEHIDIEPAVRQAICDIGYDNDELQFNGKTVTILNNLHKQSFEIAKAVLHEDGEIGAGDQGIM